MPKTIAQTGSLKTALTGAELLELQDGSGTGSSKHTTAAALVTLAGTTLTPGIVATATTAAVTQATAVTIAASQTYIDGQLPGITASATSAATTAATAAATTAGVNAANSAVADAIPGIEADVLASVHDVATAAGTAAGNTAGTAAGTIAGQTAATNAVNAAIPSIEDSVLTSVTPIATSAAQNAVNDAIPGITANAEAAGATAGQTAATDAVAAARPGIVTDVTAAVTAIVYKESILVALSDETTALTAGTNKITFRLPYDFTVESVKASLTTAQATGNVLTTDIKNNGVSILTTLITIDNTEKSSVTAATPPVVGTTALLADDEITMDITQVGDGTATGLKVAIVGHPT